MVFNGITGASPLALWWDPSLIALHFPTDNSMMTMSMLSYMLPVLGKQVTKRWNTYRPVFVYISFCFVPFRFVSVHFATFHFVSFRFVLVNFVTFRSVSVYFVSRFISHFTGTHFLTQLLKTMTMSMLSYMLPVLGKQVTKRWNTYRKTILNVWHDPLSHILISLRFVPFRYISFRVLFRILQVPIFLRNFWKQIINSRYDWEGHAIHLILFSCKYRKSFIVDIFFNFTMFFKNFFIYCVFLYSGNT
jgi:hypothetical protein